MLKADTERPLDLSQVRALAGICGHLLVSHIRRICESHLLALAISLGRI